MKQLIVALIALGIAIGAFYYLQTTQKQQQPTPLAKLIPTNTIKHMMTINSTAFQDNGTIPDKYTCKGENVNPPLSFSNVSHNAKSLVLLVDDPDAPMGTFVHWVVFNMSPDTKEIPENSVPVNSVQGVNSAQKNSYMGPCPPSGTHHYFFKLYALDIMLAADAHADKKTIEQKMQGHIIEQAQLVGLYSHR